MLRKKNYAFEQNVSEDYGSLVINVFINNVGKPAQGATVKIFDQTNNLVIEETKTDSSGQIPAITLPTPPIDYSMEPDLPRPFNQYNVSVSLPDFVEASIYNVQLYPATTALQEVTLMQKYDTIDIPYPVLYGDYPPKIPEAETKELPYPTDFVVLPKPVVPSIIVVHNGVPTDSSAANYTVSFKDYIKNVASSEIYATWPKETLKANILAMISFTLNRVYTEWYRSKGYDFTITNSTAFDQAFNYGRNIYKEISDVVDEIFTTYISKIDYVQPLFAQYSDGKRVKREGWLSQWGSKYLGDDGYTAMQILKNYYGSDIVLKEAEKVSGIPLSFPGVTLRIGSQGESVEMIQNQLNGIADNYPAIPKLIEDGIYGESTVNSVKKFQEIFNMPITGEVNFATWYKISSVYTAVKKLAEL